MDGWLIVADMVSTLESMDLDSAVEKCEMYCISWGWTAT